MTAATALAASMDTWLPPLLAAAGIVVSLGIALTALKRGATDRANLQAAKDTADLSKITADLSKLRADELQQSLDREKEKFADHVLQATRERHADQLRCAEDIAVLSGKVDLLTSTWVDDVGSRLVETFEATVARLLAPAPSTTVTSTSTTSTTEVTAPPSEATP